MEGTEREGRGSSGASTDKAATAPDAAGADSAGTAAGSEAEPSAGTRGEERASQRSGARSGTPPEGDRLSNVLRGCERSTLYHKAREGALESFHRFLMFVVVVSGSAAVYAITQDSEFKTIAAAAPAVAGAIDLVFALSRQARDHAVLARQFMDLAGDACADGAEDRLGDLQARFYRLASEEPPIYEAVESLCFNQVASASSSPTRRSVPLLYRSLRHVVRFSGKKFPLVPAA